MRPETEQVLSSIMTAVNWIINIILITLLLLHPLGALAAFIWLLPILIPILAVIALVFALGWFGYGYDRYLHWYRRRWELRHGRCWAPRQETDAEKLLFLLLLGIAYIALGFVFPTWNVPH